MTANVNVSQHNADEMGLPKNLHDCEFRADRFAYVALAGPWFVFSVILTYFMIFGNDSARGVWSMAIIVYAALVTALLYIASFRVSIRNGRLLYRHLLRGTRSILLSEIKDARVDVKLLTTPSGRPPYALCIDPLLGSDAMPFAINMKFLSRRDLRTLFDILGDKVLDKKGRMNRVIGRPRQ